jgi:ATP-dependent DNA ligase
MSSSASDPLELDGHDLRQWLFEERKRMLANLLRGQRDSISFNEIGCRVEVAAVKHTTTASSLQPHQNYLKQRASLIWRC